MTLNLRIFFNIFKKFVIFNSIRVKVIIFSNKKSIWWICHFLKSQLHVRLFLNFFLKRLHFIFVWKLAVIMICCCVLAKTFIIISKLILRILREMRRLLSCLIECNWFCISTVNHTFFVYWAIYIEVTWCFTWN